MFFYFPQKIGLDICCILFQKEKFAWNVKPYFLGKKKKKISNLLSAEIAQGLLKITTIFTLIIGTDKPEHVV